MNITIEKDQKTITIKSPYHPNFPKHAKNLGGRWNAMDKTWQFDSRDEDSVRDLCQDCFGTDGSTEPELVDCRVILDGHHNYGQSIWFAGREIAKRPSRDCPVRLGHNVVICNKGEFHSRGGSRNYPCISFSGEIILEVRDVPLILVQRERNANPDNVTILETILDEKIDMTTTTIELSEKATRCLKYLREMLRDDCLNDDEIITKALVYWHNNGFNITDSNMLIK